MHVYARAHAKTLTVASETATQQPGQTARYLLHKYFCSACTARLSRLQRNLQSKLVEGRLWNVVYTSHARCTLALVAVLVNVVAHFLRIVQTTF